MSRQVAARYAARAKRLKHRGRRRKSLFSALFGKSLLRRRKKFFGLF